MTYYGNSPTSSFGVGGPNNTQLNVPSKTITPPAYNVVLGDQGFQLNCNCLSGTVTINLLSDAEAPLGFVIFVKKIDASGNSIIIDPDGVETLNGQSTLTVSNQWDGIGLQKVSGGWISISSSGATAGSSGGGGGGGGTSEPGGAFDVGINKSDSLILTTTSITNGYQYTGAGAAIIHGINVANANDLSEIEVDVIVNDFSKTKDFYLCRNIPLPTFVADDFIRRPKVLDTNDRLKFRCNTSNAAHIYVRYSEMNSSSDIFNVTYEGTVNAVGNFENIYTESSTNGSVVDSLLLTNADGTTDIEVSVMITDGDANPLVVNKITIPAKTSVELAENPFVLMNGDIIAVEITADPTFLHVTAAGRNI